MASFAFDATNIAPATGAGAIPAGEYPVIIVNTDMKPTRDNTGQYLEVQMEVIDGPQKGAQVYDRLNLVNQNPKAQEMAQRQLSAICHAIGVLTFRDTVELHNRPLLAKLKYVDPVMNEDGSQKYAAKNEVQRYKAIGAQMPAQAPAQFAQQPQQQAPAPAWGNQQPQQQAPAQAPWANQAQPQQPVQQAAPAPVQPPWANQAA